MGEIQFRQTFRKSRGIKIHNSKILNFKKPLNFFTHFLNVFIDYTKHLALLLLRLNNYIKFSLKNHIKKPFFNFLVSDRQISNYYKFIRKL